MPIKDSKIIEAFSEKSQIELVPGGCSYNTMRVLNVFFLIANKPSKLFSLNFLLFKFFFSL